MKKQKRSLNMVVRNSPLHSKSEMRIVKFPTDKSKFIKRKWNGIGGVNKWLQF